MRLALVALAMTLMATAAESREWVVRLSWTEAAPEGSEAVLLLRDDKGDIIASLIEDVAPGEQVHRIDLPPMPRTAMTVQSGLSHSGRVFLQSQVRQIADRAELDLDMPLHPSLAVGFSDVWDCGDIGIIRMTHHPDALRIIHDGERVELAADPDAPDQFSDADGSLVEFDGNRADVTLQGDSSTNCKPSLFTPVLPLLATAHDGSWMIDLGLEDALLDLPGLENETLATSGLRISAPRNGEIEVRGPGLEMRLSDMLCRIAGTDLLYPYSAALSLQEDQGVFRGCAGNPLALLSGGTWSVSSLFGVAIDIATPDARELTLQINKDQVSGRGTCNRYVGTAKVEAGRLALRDLGTTRLACPTKLRNIESRFLDALEGATGFDISRDGMLILRAGPVAILTATRR